MAANKLSFAGAKSQSSESEVVKFHQFNFPVDLILLCHFKIKIHVWWRLFLPLATLDPSRANLVGCLIKKLKIIIIAENDVE